MDWSIDNLDNKKRLDIFLLEKNPDKTRSHIKKWIEDGIALVNGKEVKAGYSLKVGDIVSLGEVVEQVVSAKPQDIPTCYDF